MMFSICALAAALTVRLPSRLDTSVACVAISASGIATGFTVRGGNDSAAFGDTGGVCSAASAANGEGEESTSKTKTSRPGQDRGVFR